MTTNEYIELEVSRADLALLHDLLDIHVGTMRTAALRAERDTRRDPRWQRTKDELWAECEQAGTLRRRFARELDTDAIIATVQRDGA